MLRRKAAPHGADDCVVSTCSSATNMSSGLNVRTARVYIERLLPVIADQAVRGCEHPFSGVLPQ